ncbi:NADH-quinone oxidoreductase subunit J family protein [Mesoterricola silvestris]|uniref:NADH-quinone oxidoreductase subunit J n=1 Tax=Mesoterricola silvestris TaxID=2927979 RepID=A0AA48KA93_9BACT|nr:NADH-quinone oxidoreductase subunit J [Mesoterricola silvestris]BDU74794.1 NADH:ubiquinone oxidoreductase subunit J [Mesoterricola silvestris]
MFLTFALITLLGALSLAFQKNLVVAGLCMVLTFFGVAGLFLLLANPVAAALQVIVYSGAIVVLVLFVIMLLSAHEEEEALKAHAIQRWGSAAAALALAGGAVKVVLSSSFLRTPPSPGIPPPMDLGALGNALFKNHLAAFEIVGLLLLATMVGAVVLVKRDL